MALHRGIQSAIFYYVSCAPCAEARYRKKRKEEAVRGRADMDALEAEMPDLYRHPSPSSTNPFWDSEIAAGPVLSIKGRRKGAGAGHSSESQRGLKTSMTQQSRDSAVPSSIDLSSGLGSMEGTREGGRILGGEGRKQDGAGGLWPTRSTDDPLRSSSTIHTATSISSDGSAGITRPPKARTRGSDSSTRRRLNRVSSNPRVNDMLPAIATHIGSKEEAHSLMLGPPPSEQMKRGDGVFVSMSRSDSGTSGRLSARSNGPQHLSLSREISRRKIERQMPGRSEEAMSRQPSEAHSSSTSLGRGQGHDRTAVEAKDFAQHEEDTDAVYLERTAGSEDPNVSGAMPESLLLAPSAAYRMQSKRATSRPELSTIYSTDSAPRLDMPDTQPAPPTIPPSSSGSHVESRHENVQPSHTVPQPSMTLSSLPVNSNSTNDSTNDKAEMELLPSGTRSTLMPSPIPLTPPNRTQVTRHPNLKPLNTTTKLLATATATTTTATLSTSSPATPTTLRRSRGRQPSQDLQDSGLSAEIFDSWYTRDFALDEWVHEHTKREVTQRWSMDI